ncbi:hypothetical protein [Variovorax paradoxus]|uniref:hypothetical protein n=1 Tax=Variovorax paradoxus TaxID=34073 RepID=UPI0029C8A918|nr:hypothetical protein [Variovorax paradoxus]WPH22492.1 hypothetical protein RZE78_10085 [Variovorax paradoxus]
MCALSDECCGCLLAWYARVHPMLGACSTFLLEASGMKKDSVKQIRPGAFAESVAGEEDPGASVDLVQPPPMRPGDEAPQGTPGTGETVCRLCGGSGRSKDGEPCPQCGGTGKVNVGIGGG